MHVYQNLYLERSCSLLKEKYLNMKDVLDFDKMDAFKNLILFCKRTVSQSNAYSILLTFSHWIHKWECDSQSQQIWYILTWLFFFEDSKGDLNKYENDWSLSQRSVALDREKRRRNRRNGYLSVLKNDLVLNIFTSICTNVRPIWISPVTSSLLSLWHSCQSWKVFIIHLSHFTERSLLIKGRHP